MNPKKRGSGVNNVETDPVYEYSGDEYYDEYEEGDDLYEECNRVVVHKMGSDQFTKSGIKHVYKVDDTFFYKIRSEHAWRLKAIARMKHNQVQSRSDKSHFTMKSVFLFFWQAMLTLGEIFVSQAVEPFQSVWDQVSNLILGCKGLVMAFRANSRRTWACVNTITVDCSRVQSSEMDEIYELYGSKASVDDAIRQKAIKELRSAMERGKTENLDNMPVTLGNSRAEAQLRCRVRAKVVACPDSGASRSLCSPQLAKRIGCKIIKEKINISNASGSSMHYSGTAFFSVTFENKTIDVPVLLTTDIGNRVIIGKYDLIRLHVLPTDFPRILPGRMFRDETI